MSEITVDSGKFLLKLSMTIIKIPLFLLVRTTVVMSEISSHVLCFANVMTMGEGRSKQDLLESTKKIVGNCAFFRDN